MTAGRLFLSVALAAGISAAVPDSARSAPVSGRAFFDIYSPTKNRFSKPLTQLSASLWLNWDHQFGEEGESRWSSRLTFEANAFDFNNAVVTGVGESTHVESALREGYLNYVNGGFDLRAGRVIVPWGKSDVVNPTDYLTAKNYTFFNPDSEVQRGGGAGLIAAWTPENLAAWSFTAVVNPYFAEGRFLIAPGVLPPGVSVESPTRPETGKVDNFESAVKIAYSGESWDASLSGYKGWNHYPEFTEKSHALVAPGVVAVDLKQIYRKQSAAGFDFSWNREKWTYRGESAFFWTENQNGQNMLSTPMHHDTVVGAERPIGDDFRVQAQYIYRYFPNYRPLDEVTGPDPVSASVNQQIARANALLFQYQDRNNGSVTFRVSYMNESSGWDAEIFFMENIAGQDFLVRPKISYAATDTLRYTLGADVYGGPDHRTLGAMNPYNSVFLEAKSTF